MLSTITAEKAALRRSVKEIPLTDSERQASDLLLFQRFLALPQLARREPLLLYYGIGSEPDTAQLLEPLSLKGIPLFLPRCLPGQQIEARLFQGPNSLSPGLFHIPEPDESCPSINRDSLSIILVPGLAFDKQGFRLGHGGGYYDRYLAGFTGLTVALCRDKLLFPSIPVEPHDHPIDLILTETRCLSRF